MEDYCHQSWTNHQPPCLYLKYDDPYNKASNSVNIDINPTNEQTIKGEVDDSSKVIGDSLLFNRFGSDPDKTKQEVDDSSIVIKLQFSMLLYEQ
jgi:hypothetical protein